MHSFRSNYSMLFSYQRLMSMVLIAVLSAALFPVCVSSDQTVQSKDRSQPFPCQDRPCGCRSAQVCKKQCCCFTPAQKQAWGRKHRVKTFELSQAEVDTKNSHNLNQKGCCLTTRPDPSRPQSASNTQADRTPSEDQTPQRPTSRPRLVIGLFAQQCQGVAHSVTGLPLFILPPFASTLTVAVVDPERLTLEDSRFEQRASDPPDPPPRLALASFL